MNVISDSADVADSALVVNSQIGCNCMVGRNSRFCYSSMGDYSYISENTHVFSSEIGRFSSISWNVSIGPANHDYKRGSQHSMLFAPRFGMISSSSEAAYHQYDGNVVIGSDVWIGCGACVTRGVTVGDGAIIGAGAFVSKDVPPYSIVVDSNRLLKQRFSDSVISELLKLRWWDYPNKTIRKCIGLLSREMVTVEDVLALRDGLEGAL